MNNVKFKYFLVTDNSMKKAVIEAKLNNQGIQDLIKFSGYENTTKGGGKVIHPSMFISRDKRVVIIIEDWIKNIWKKDENLFIEISKLEFHKIRENGPLIKSS